MPERIETRLAELYVDNLEGITRGWPTYVNDMRRELLEGFTLCGLPGGGDEAYRHFDLRARFAPVKRLATRAGAIPGESPFMVDGLRSIVVENGNCLEEGLVRLHNGVVYGSLKMAASELPELVKRYYNSSVDTAADMPSVLNGAFCPDGAFVYVPEGCDFNETIHIDIRYGAAGPGEIGFPRMLVVAGDDSHCQIAVTHSDLGSSPMVSCHVTELFAGRGATVQATEAVAMRGDSILVSGNYSVQGEGSKISGTAVWLDGGAMRINYNSTLAGRESETTLYGLYLAGEEQLCDVNMKVRHQVPDCRSYEVIKGVVSGSATGAFTGMVYVAPDAQRTSALQQSRNLQLSDSARVYTEPQLEIYADDVKCSHGATVGQLDDEAVLYMRQRGISEHDAKRLQLWGFVNDVIQHCGNGEICDKITELAQKRIASL